MEGKWIRQKIEEWLDVSPQTAESVGEALIHAGLLQSNDGVQSFSSSGVGYRVTLPDSSVDSHASAIGLDSCWRILEVLWRGPSASTHPVQAALLMAQSFLILASFLFAILSAYSGHFGTILLPISSTVASVMLAPNMRTQNINTIPSKCVVSSGLVLIIGGLTSFAICVTTGSHARGTSVVEYALAAAALVTAGVALVATSISRDTVIQASGATAFVISSLPDGAGVSLPLLACWAGVNICLALGIVSALQYLDRRNSRARETIETSKQSSISNMSHQLRTPMNALLPTLQLLMQTDVSPLQKKYTDICLSASEKMLHTVNGILDYNKLDTGMFSLERGSFNIRSSLEWAFNVVNSISKQKRIELIGCVEEPCPSILFGDKERVHQLLLNYLTVVLQSSESGTTLVRVSVDELSDDEYLNFSQDKSKAGDGASSSQCTASTTGEQQAGRARASSTGDQVRNRTRRMLLRSNEGGQRMTPIKLRFTIVDCGNSIDKKVLSLLTRDSPELQNVYDTFGVQLNRRLVKAFHGHAGVSISKDNGSSLWFSVILQTRLDDITQSSESHSRSVTVAEGEEGGAGSPGNPSIPVLSPALRLAHTLDKKRMTYPPTRETPACIRKPLRDIGAYSAIPYGVLGSTTVLLIHGNTVVRNVLKQLLEPMFHIEVASCLEHSEHHWKRFSVESGSSQSSKLNRSEADPMYESRNSNRSSGSSLFDSRSSGRKSDHSRLGLDGPPSVGFVDVDSTSNYDDALSQSSRLRRRLSDRTKARLSLRLLTHEFSDTEPLSASAPLDWDKENEVGQDGDREDFGGESDDVSEVEQERPQIRRKVSSQSANGRGGSDANQSSFQISYSSSDDEQHLVISRPKVEDEEKMKEAVSERTGKGNITSIETSRGRSLSIISSPERFPRDHNSFSDEDDGDRDEDDGGSDNGSDMSTLCRLADVCIIDEDTYSLLDVAELAPEIGRLSARGVIYLSSSSNLDTQWFQNVSIPMVKVLKPVQLHELRRSIVHILAFNLSRPQRVTQTKASTPPSRRSSTSSCFSRRRNSNYSMEAPNLSVPRSSPRPSPSPGASPRLAVSPRRRSSALSVIGRSRSQYQKMMRKLSIAESPAEVELTDAACSSVDNSVGSGGKSSMIDGLGVAEANAHKAEEADEEADEHDDQSNSRRMSIHSYTSRKGIIDRQAKEAAAPISPGGTATASANDHETAATVHETVDCNDKCVAPESSSFSGLSPSTWHRTSTKTQVLIAEDNAMSEMVLRFLLTEMGFQVSTAHDGVEAVEAYTSNPLAYDVILMDLDMPRKSGTEATEDIRAFEQGKNMTRSVPIVAVTASALDGDMIKCVQAGMDGFLTKPARKETITETLMQLHSKGRMSNPFEVIS